MTLSVYLLSLSESVVSRAHARPRGKTISITYDITKQPREAYTLPQTAETILQGWAQKFNDTTARRAQLLYAHHTLSQTATGTGSHSPGSILSKISHTYSTAVLVLQRWELGDRTIVDCAHGIRTDRRFHGSNEHVHVRTTGQFVTQSQSTLYIRFTTPPQAIERV